MYKIVMRCTGKSLLQTIAEVDGTLSQHKAG